MPGDNRKMVMSLSPWLPASTLSLLVLWILMSLLHDVDFDDADFVGDVLNWYCRQRR
jgi:hypothetical protein